MDLSAFKGAWFNTNSGPKQIEKIVLRPDGEKLYLDVSGSLHPAPKEWGEVAAESLYADAVHSRKCMAFLARYSFPSLDVDVGVNLNQGLLVMALFTTFKDDGRFDYFAREFFRQ